MGRGMNRSVTESVDWTGSNVQLRQGTVAIQRNVGPGSVSGKCPTHQSLDSGESHPAAERSVVRPTKIVAGRHLCPIMPCCVGVEASRDIHVAVALRTTGGFARICSGTMR